MSYPTDCEIYLDRAYRALVMSPARYQRVKEAAARLGVSGLLEQYIEELDDMQGIGSNSHVRKVESADARAYLKSLEPPTAESETEAAALDEKHAALPLIRLAYAALPDSKFVSVINAWDAYGNPEMLAEFLEEAQSVWGAKTVELLRDYRKSLFDDSNDQQILARVEEIRKFRQ